jgi:hypothetical protein
MIILKYFKDRSYKSRKIGFRQMFLMFVFYVRRKLSGWWYGALNCVCLRQKYSTHNTALNCLSGSNWRTWFQAGKFAMCIPVMISITGSGFDNIRLLIDVLKCNWRRRLIAVEKHIFLTRFYRQYMKVFLTQSFLFSLIKLGFISVGLSVPKTIGIGVILIQCGR